MRPIDADKLERHEADTYGAIEDVVYAEDIDNAPTLTLDDIIPHGRYITDEQGDSSCSVCGEKYLNITHNYCPYCGARMDGEKM